MRFDVHAQHLPYVVLDTKILVPDCHSKNVSPDKYQTIQIFNLQLMFHKMSVELHQNKTISCSLCPDRKPVSVPCPAYTIVSKMLLLRIHIYAYNTK